MAEIQVKVGSVTNAQKAKRLLKQNGYYCYIRRSADIKKGEGCGYSVIFRGDSEKGLNILENSGIRIISVKQK